MGGISSAGYGAAARQIHRAVSECLLQARQAERIYRVFLQAPARCRRTDLRKNIGHHRFDESPRPSAHAGITFQRISRAAVRHGARNLQAVQV